MKRCIILVAAFFGVALLSAAFASAWTVRGYVYIDESEERPAPCATVECWTASGCTDTRLDSVWTDEDGYFELDAQNNDTVYIKLIFDPELLVPPTSCEYCTKWHDCEDDIRCMEAHSWDMEWPVFDLDQPKCECVTP